MKQEDQAAAGLYLNLQLRDLLLELSHGGDVVGFPQPNRHHLFFTLQRRGWGGYSATRCCFFNRDVNRPGYISYLSMRASRFTAERLLLLLLLRTLHSISACLLLISCSCTCRSLFCVVSVCTLSCRQRISCSARRSWLLWIWFWVSRVEKPVDLFPQNKLQRLIQTKSCRGQP